MPSGIINLRKNTQGVATNNLNVSGIIGAGIPIGDKQIFSDTTENWNTRTFLIGKKDCLYVYTDYKQEDGKDIPAFKVGDGLAYLIDLPFSYMGNVTAEQIEFWNNKVTAFIDTVEEENLILSKD